VNDAPEIPPPQGDSNWFRSMTPREHWIAAALFAAFGAFFILLAFVQRGWWFGWVILLLGLISLVRGVQHVFDATRHEDPEP
jgi:hypothetical protein